MTNRVAMTCMKAVSKKGGICTTLFGLYKIERGLTND